MLLLRASVFAHKVASCQGCTADLHESSIRSYRITPGSKGASNAAVTVVKLPAVTKQSRQPFAGSDITIQLLSEGKSVLLCRSSHSCYQGPYLESIM